MDIFAVAVWHVITVRKSDILHLIRKDSLQLGFAGKAKAKLKHSSSCLYVMEWSWTWDSPNKGSQLRVERYFLPRCCHSCQMSKVVHPAPHTLRERDWITRSKILSTWGLALIPEVCIWQDESSVQPGCPAKAFIPLHTVHCMDWLLLQGMCLCIPACPQQSPQCRMCRQGHR